jgi:hypothetical protein
MNIDNEISLHYTVTDAHDHDIRTKHARARLCVSAKIGMNSPWLSCDVITNGSHIDGIPLIKVKDMRTTAVRPAGPTDFKCGPAERACQRGPDACETTLTKLVAGIGADTKCKIIAVDMNPQQGDWLDACWNVQQKWMAGGGGGGGGGNAVFVGYTCMVKTECPEYVQMFESQAKGMLMKKWWDNSTSAGSAEPIATTDELVAKPNLTLCSWDGGNPKIADIVYKKFAEGSDCYESWKTLCMAHGLTLAKMAITTSLQATTSTTTMTPPVLTGPDMSVEPTAIDMSREEVLECVPSAEFVHDATQFTCRAQRNLPVITVQKDFSMWLSLDEATHGNSMEVGPVELFGFNTGDFIVGDRGSFECWTLRQAKHINFQR